MLFGVIEMLEKIVRFVHKSQRDKWIAVKETFRHNVTRLPAQLKQRRQQLLISQHTPPKVLRGDQRFYLAYRPDSDAFLSRFPELAELSAKWVYNNVQNNGGDLPRLYSIALNTREILEDEVPGHIAELGVYRGNSAAVLGHYARTNGRT